MNVVCLMGRLCADPELKYTQSRIAVTSFTLAVDRAYTPKGQEKQADFITIVAWRERAELISKYFGKGSKILIHGTIQTRTYEDKNGNKRTVFEVVANDAYFCEGKKQSSAPDVSVVNTDFEEIVGDDELPF